MNINRCLEYIICDQILTYCIGKMCKEQFRHKFDGQYCKLLKYTEVVFNSNQKKNMHIQTKKNYLFEK